MDQGMYDVADIHSIADDGQSLSDKVGDAITKGVPAALASGVISVLNTGISLGNVFGDYEKINTEDAIRGYDDDLGSYYKANKEYVDLGGFIATSLVPGTLATKGLKALQGIKGGVALGTASENILGYAASTEARALKAAAETIAGPEQLIFGTLNANKLKAIAAGAGDQALQGLAFETGVLLTMNQNPVINPDDRDYFSSIWHNIPQSLHNAAIWGAVGGVLGAATITGKINKIKRAEDIENFGAINAQIMGDSTLDPGTRYAHMYNQIEQWKQGYSELTDFERFASGEVPTQKYLDTHAKTIGKMQSGLDKFSTEFASNDGELSAAFRKLVADIPDGVMENGFKISKQELLARAIGGGKSLDRLGMKLVEEGVAAPGSALLKATERAIKLIGDGRGDISNLVYPVAGDLGKVEIKSNGLYIDNTYRHVNLPYEPLTNPPTDSSIQFLYQKISKPLKDNDNIPIDNLPVLEKAWLEKAPITIERDGFQEQLAGSEVDALLRERKIIAMNDLINAGKDKDYIARAINVPKEFLDNPNGAPLSLSIMEDHTKPLFGKISYATQNSAESFAAQGMLKVYEDATLSVNKLLKAATYVLGEDVKLFEKPSKLYNVTTISDVAGFLKSGNAPYGSFGAKAQQDGKMEQAIFDKIATARAEVLHGAQSEIVTDPAQLVEMNVIFSKLRSGDSGWVKLPDDLYTGSAKPGEIILIQKKALQNIMKEKDALTAMHTLTNSVAKDSGLIIRIDGESAVGKYLEDYHYATSTYADKRNVLNGAKGSTRYIDPAEYYAPPIDTSRQPYFVMIRAKQPLAAENPFTYVVAPNAVALEKKVAAIKQQYGDTLELFTSTDVKNKKMIDGTYESGEFFTKTSVDSALQSKGLLTDFIPRTDDYIFKEIDNWMARTEHSLVRQSIESIRSDEFAQLRFMADNYGELYSSKFGGKALEPADNPYLQLINTSLNVSNKGHYDKFWGELNRGANSAWNAATEIGRKLWPRVESGELSAVEADKIAESHGWRAPYGDIYSEVWNPLIPDPNALNKFVAKANRAVSTLMIRMDGFNAVVNTISLPILMKAELESIKKNLDDPTIVGKLSNLMSEQVPGSAHRIPSMLSLAYDGTRAYVKNDKVSIGGVQRNLHEYFTEIGAIKTDPQLLRSAMDAVPMTSDMIKSEKGVMAYVSNLSKRVGELGAKYTGNDLAEDFVRFQAAHAMWRVATEAGITDAAELSGYINTYVNRVHGNYLASQRPTIFQGPVGQAIGLFQTYQFNLMQQMTRYLQQGDRGAAISALALQNTIFGMQSNPLFYQLNQYIGESNRAHQDIFSTVEGIGGVAGAPKIAGIWDTNPARWLMYGLGANALQVNLYSRGDLTPRYASVVPTSLVDIPAVSVPLKAITSFLDSMSAINNGAPPVQSILHGLAHSGFNRPLAGLAGLAAGGRTTSQGTLLNAYNDIDGFLVAATLAGGRPLNEAVLLDQYNRQQAYHASDMQKIGEIAEAVKLTATGQKGILNPEQTTDFLSRYAESGGQQSRATRFLMDQAHNSQQTVVDKMKNNYHTVAGKRMRETMAGGGSGFGEVQNLNTAVAPPAEE